METEPAEEQDLWSTGVPLCTRHFRACLGKNTPPLCYLGSSQILALVALNFPHPALGTSPAQQVGQGPFPRYSVKVRAAALAQGGRGSQHLMLF